MLWDYGFWLLWDLDFVGKELLFSCSRVAVVAMLSTRVTKIVQSSCLLHLIIVSLTKYQQVLPTTAGPSLYSIP
jgi:hypothetical protein